VDVPGSAKSEIRLGVLGIQTGPIGNAVIPVVQGTKAWAADVNARGGLAGRPVRLIIADDGGDPNRALALVKRLVEENKVHSLFAVHMPTDLQAIVPYLEEKQVPAIGTCACDTTFGESPMVFGLGMSGLTALTWAHLLPITAQTDKRKAGVLYCREASICGGLAQQIDAVQAKSGVTVAFKAQMSLAQPDYTAEVLAARNAGADVIIVLADNATLIRVARSAHRQGYFPLFAGQHSSNEDRFLANGGEDVEGAVISAALAEYSSSPLLADYRAAMDRYVPGGIKGSLGALAWAAGKALEVIAPRLPANPTPADIIEGMYSLKGETLGGIVPPTTFERGKGHDATNQCVVPLRIVDRKFAIHNPANPFVCVPGWKPVGS
jgi:branched-chain amino acid transport system substrate-binding protein